MWVNLKIFVLFLAIGQQSCQAPSDPTVKQEAQPTTDTVVQSTRPLQTGAEQTNLYLPYLANQNVAMVVNHTSRIGDRHLVDSLLARGASIKKIFAPEHGFRGTADAGEHIDDGRDPSTGLPIISLYGNHKEPTATDLAGIDLIVFDIQDVGARFYTYISTLHYVMQAGAKLNIPILVLDRPNPNGHYVDGPILDMNYQSFVGMHPIPVVHGMTIGEYAQMINGEGWLDEEREAQLKVIPCANYDHQTPYDLPAPPSPNLPNMRSIYLYPSLCFFEGTVFSVGRGTDTQFQVYGHPDFTIGSYQFTPVPGAGARYPKHENKTCYGMSLVSQSPGSIREEAQLNLSYLMQAYQHFSSKEEFFLSNRFIDKLAGGSSLREQIQAGWSEEQIRESWSEGLDRFNSVRSRYLLYP